MRASVPRMTGSAITQSGHHEAPVSSTSEPKKRRKSNGASAAVPGGGEGVVTGDERDEFGRGVESSDLHGGTLHRVHRALKVPDAVGAPHAWTELV
jgi:hypothetical protein